MPLVFNLSSRVFKIASCKMEEGGFANVVGLNLNLLFAISKARTVCNTHTCVCVCVCVCVCEISVLISSVFKEDVSE